MIMRGVTSMLKVLIYYAVAMAGTLIGLVLVLIVAFAAWTLYNIIGEKLNEWRKKK